MLNDAKRIWGSGDCIWDFGACTWKSGVHVVYYYYDPWQCRRRTCERSRFGDQYEETFGLSGRWRNGDWLDSGATFAHQDECRILPGACRRFADERKSESPAACRSSHTWSQTFWSQFEEGWRASPGQSLSAVRRSLSFLRWCVPAIEIIRIIVWHVLVN